MDVELLNQPLLRDLAAIDGEPVLSIYLPTVGDDGDAQQPPIHLKNLVRDAERQLLARGKPEEATARWLRPAAELADEPPLWRRHGEGLGVFRWRGQLRVVRLPRAVEPCVYVGARAYLVPMLDPRAAGRFALLTLSLKRVRLLECSRYTATRMNHPDLPDDYESALGKYTDTERQLQYHTGTPHAGGIRAERAAMYHGHGAAGDDAVTQARRLEFCRVIDRAVRDRLRGSELPLVLAADVPLAAIYRQVNRYHPLLDDTVAGSFDHLDDAAVRDKALPLIEAGVTQATADAVRRFRETPPDGVARGVAAALEAALDGRVELLLMRAGERRWGRLRDRRVEEHAQPAHGDEELVNLAACLTLASSGDALALAAGESPSPEPACAVLRY